jgi:hypothetical protein
LHQRGKNVSRRNTLQDGLPLRNEPNSAVLWADNRAQRWLPLSFAHEFCGLEPEAEVVFGIKGVVDVNIIASQTREIIFARPSKPRLQHILVIGASSGLGAALRQQ